ncbi:hypothetical protein Tco_0477839 [Tanacetum coccineum]
MLMIQLRIGLKGSEGTSRIGKLEFPKFYGEDVKGWLFRVKKFFAVDNVPDALIKNNTSCMCMECWGHGSFAHALIEMEATVGLKDKLVVAIPKMPSTSNTLAKARKQKDAQDEFLECETEDKGGNWDNQVKHQGSGFTKSTNGSYRLVVKPNAITPVSNVFFDLEEDNEKPMDDLVADTRKKVEAPPKKTSI